MKSNLDIEKILSDATPLQPEEWQSRLVNSVMAAAESYSKSSKIPVGNCFAAAFDLIVAAHYYGNIANKGWLYCGPQQPILLYPYTNTCPRCAVKNDFYFHKANKPRSGNIGSITSMYLCLCYKWFFDHSGQTVEILSGKEPVDVVFLERKKQYCLLAEIKASPLATFPLATLSDKLTEEGEAGRKKIRPHEETIIPRLTEVDLYMLLPDGPTKVKLIKLGKKTREKDTVWAAKAITDLCKAGNFFDLYLKSWLDVFRKYKGEIPRNGSFWLTNSCGAPAPMPSHWPRRSGGSGYETISDNKTSVGMDRTDDIKKGTYQVLKIGSVSKFPPSASWHIKVGLVSNIHAIQHYEEYLASIIDVVWTKSGNKAVKFAKELPPDTRISNLFDGVIAFTSLTIRDEWLKSIFSFGVSNDKNI